MLSAFWKAVGNGGDMLWPGLRRSQTSARYDMRIDPQRVEEKSSRSGGVKQLQSATATRPDDSSREFIAEHYPWFLDTFNDYKYAIQRADAIRYFVLHHYGGVYLDSRQEVLTVLVNPT
ncbi:hypothetical protein HHX47_DHR4001039 [Lentinula edodes]|nr:hypothetical protein HHX47_DHR4001039 [Lentinula edodes]